MNRTTDVFYRLGYWGAVLFTITGILYGVSMGVLLSKYPIPKYIDLEQYLMEVDNKFIDLYSFSQGFAFVSTLLFVFFLCTVHLCVQQTKKFISLLSICFGSAFMILACINYFVQFSIVRQSIHLGVTQNLENLVQFNPNSLMNAINMLAWTLFLGLTCLLLGFLFKGVGIKLYTNLSFFVTSLFCLIGFFGFVFNEQFLLLIFQLGMTAGLTVSAIFVAIVFYKRIPI
ncbi:hypothetical protein HNQ94_000099 [Salirhabdus euzebyi]|uniref:DUF4386 domain-containing protein n=1 Tax=Salirhabdus euzebyi TaxID=394506 RepID=A0A841Q2W0_9BACI|nr:hypothetical protein [Salirhabdus euzebyi]MBB6451678.1 hypothetical protein [Salirhabdus euzebyi]